MSEAARFKALRKYKYLKNYSNMGNKGYIFPATATIRI